MYAIALSIVEFIVIVELILWSGIIIKLKAQDTTDYYNQSIVIFKTVNTVIV